MTVVAAVARDGHVTMAADTQTNYCDSPLYGARKIRRFPFTNDRGEVLLAFSGNGALGAVLAAHLKLDSAPRDGDDLDQWAEAVALAATEVLAGATPPLLDSRPEGAVIDGAMLLGHTGRLWYLFTHQAVPVPDGIAALGSGSDIALGTMHTGLGAGQAPLDAVVGAVELACRFAPGCGVDASGARVELLA